ncbi:MAG: hypothetical protein QGI06_05780 [Rhodospirillales bacterium]|jgi:Sec-independent protein translocase protein TatA|nr:hypothetical protein [Rhodospirillales bacterium]|tara:strand:+ start:270 stop:524 length:255 start_codon:yes stop_codon:yes gene_type:complete
MAVDPNLPIKDYKPESAVLKQMREAVRAAGQHIEESKEALKNPKEPTEAKGASQENIDDADREDSGNTNQQATDTRGDGVDIET